MTGADLGACVAAERARGFLPPGALADPILKKLIPDVEVIARVAHDDHEPISLDVNVTLADGSSVVGTVANVRGEVVYGVSFSRLSAAHRLHAWMRLLALTAARPERPYEAVTVARVRATAPPHTHVSIARIGVLGVDPATRQTVASRSLEVLVDLYRRGMREPLPIYCKTSAAWAQAAPRNRDRVARKQWKSEWNFSNEDKDAEHRAVLGGIVPFERLLDEPPRDDENGDGWDSAEESRFGRYARRLWAYLLAHEQVTDQ
jgi:exodeoxyribonuclease V gamma subunit